MKMGTKYKFLKYTLASSLLMPLSFGTDLQETITEVTTVTIDTVSAPVFNTTSATSSASTDATFNVTVYDNSSNGFTIQAKGLNAGYLVASGDSTKDGDLLEYTMVCGNLTNDAGDSISNAFSSAKAFGSANTLENVYVLASPKVTTCTASSGAVAPCTTSPTCTIALSENPNDSFAGDYTETITFTIS
jgi:archaellin